MTKKNYSALLEKLRALRIQFGFTQLSIANYLSISKEAYRKIEGGRAPLSMERFLLICEFFNKHPLDVLNECITSHRQSDLQIELIQLNQGMEEIKEERLRLWNLIQRMNPPMKD